MSLSERDHFYRLLGARDQQIHQLERLLSSANEEWSREAKEWRRLQRYREELAEWLVDQAMNPFGKLTNSPIDAALRGESFVPCTCMTTIGDRKFQLSLVTTEYEVNEIESAACS